MTKEEMGILQKYFSEEKIAGMTEWNREFFSRFYADKEKEQEMKTRIAQGIVSRREGEGGDYGHR